MVYMVNTKQALYTTKSKIYYVLFLDNEVMAQTLDKSIIGPICILIIILSEGAAISQIETLATAILYH